MKYRRSWCAQILLLSLILGLAGTGQADTAASQPDEGAKFQARVYADDQGNQLPYRLLVPDESDEPMPVLLFLHGVGERGDDNRAQLTHGKDLMLTAARDFGFIVVAPQCHAEEKWSRVDLPKNIVRFSDEPTEPMRLTLELIDDLSDRYDVDQTRLYIIGLSMGGHGTWDAVSREPGRFAAAAPICGVGDPAMGERIARVPVWAFHGDADRVVPVDFTRAMINAIKDAGGEPKYTEYPGVGHGSWVPAFAEPGLLPWLTQQRLAEQPAQTQTQP